MLQYDELSSAVARRRRLAPPAPAAGSSEASEAPARPETTAAGSDACKWRRYSSIDSCHNAAGLQAIRAAVAAQLGPDCEWVATEKVHGANFCFGTDGERIEYAPRTSKLGNGADFFNARETMPRYHPFVASAYRIAKEREPSLTSLLIYGEYFGGYYPGLPAEPGRKKIQGGVAYSPGHHFYAFDVRVDGERYMDFDEARALLVAAGFPLVAAPLARGPLDTLLGLDVEALATTVPAQLGHPPPDRFRIAEGVVIRPAREVGFDGRRAILKKKAQAFWEATNQPGKMAAAPPAGGPPLGPEGLLEDARGLINENRLRAVVSKDPGLLAVANPHRLAGLLAQDALEDLEKVRGEELQAAGKELPALKKYVQFLARGFVAEHIQRLREDVG